MANAYEGDLERATDREWLVGHEALRDLVADDPSFPNSELEFVWDPKLDPARLIHPTETDHGPARDAD